MLGKYKRDRDDDDDGTMMKSSKTSKHSGGHEGKKGRPGHFPTVAVTVFMYMSTTVIAM